MLFSPRNVHQEPRNYEKGVLFVPLLIHLPPPSDDISVGGRDARDVVDENVSKARTIYDIIASTFDDAKKKGKIGQTHFAFEIVGSGGNVKLYAEVPVELVEVVKQAVVSAYPSARLQEVTDHNIFNPSVGFETVAGGELTLKENYAFPLATYQDIKRDTMQSLLSSMSTLSKDDGAAVQILIRPASDLWRKNALGIATKKRKGKYDTKSGYEVVGTTLKQMAVALVKAPEEVKKDGDKEDLSGVERSLIDAIEEKTKHPGFETIIRLVVSSPTPERSAALLNNVVAAFSVFNAPGKNGLQFNRSDNVEELTAAYLLRAFPLKQREFILNAVELATIFHFPDQSNIPTSQLTRQESKQVDGPRNMPDDGTLLGYNVFRGAKKAIRISTTDRQRHIYAVGQTGTGKSTFLEDLALQDMLNGNGFAFVDPHGDTAEKLLAMVPKERVDDVIYFSPADMAHPMGLNLFEFNSPDQKDFLVQEALNMLYKLYDPQHQGIMGPRYEHLFRNAALVVMADPAGGTFIDIPKLFRDPQYVKQKLQYVTDQTTLEFWQKEMPQSQRSNEFGDVVSWFVSKFGAFLSNEMMRNIIGQTKSAFDLRDVMDNKKILLVNLSKGRLGELNSKLLGMIFVMKFQAAAMSRASIPEDQRVDFSLYVDEFQNFSTDSFATIMSEARKYHLNLIVANQFTTQLTEEIRDAVFGNMGTIVSFRVGQNDVDMLSKYFQPAFSADDLLRVPNYNTIVRTLVNGVPTQPFSMMTLPPLGKPNQHLAEALKQLSAAKYGRPKAKVEEEIFARMKTITPEPKAATPKPSSPWQSTPGPANSPAVAGAAASGTKSFLDEWLSKKHKMARPPEPTIRPASNKPSAAPEPTSTMDNPEQVVPTNSPDTEQINEGEPAVPNAIDHYGESTHKVIKPIHDLHKPSGEDLTREAQELDEVNGIAKELKKDIEDHKDTVVRPNAAESSDPEAPPQPLAPHESEEPKDLPSPKPSVPRDKVTPGTAVKPQKPEDNTPAPPPRITPLNHDENDTIKIDKDGNLIYKERPDASAN